PTYESGLCQALNCSVSVRSPAGWSGVPNNRIAVFQAFLVVVLEHSPLLRIDALWLKRSGTLDACVDPAMLCKQTVRSLVVRSFDCLGDKQDAVMLGTCGWSLSVFNLRMPGKLGPTEKQYDAHRHLCAELQRFGKIPRRRAARVAH